MPVTKYFARQTHQADRLAEDLAHRGVQVTAARDFLASNVVGGHATRAVRESDQSKIRRLVGHVADDVNVWIRRLHLLVDFQANGGSSLEAGVQRNPDLWAHISVKDDEVGVDPPPCISCCGSSFWRGPYLRTRHS